MQQLMQDLGMQYQGSGRTFCKKIPSTGTLAIYNSKGVEVMKKELVYGDNTFDISYLVSNLYVITIETGERMQAKKMVK